MSFYTLWATRGSTRTSSSNRSRLACTHIEIIHFYPILELSVERFTGDTFYLQISIKSHVSFFHVGRLSLLAKYSRSL
ncbi:hypothetical protein KPSA1_02953 [Pseudomonas syringae pv. actinidiae]|uniref:Uncharacterized protein n=1 Tax=Pseudomonas syringae pv. actinidiae TaxID=103796 RepID=A0A2V0Q9Q7_PSESF|nr:hypothetical protein KPSA1_02953 [Pseudomonas syringae pv. actinidiae]